MGSNGKESGVGGALMGCQVRRGAGFAADDRSYGEIAGAVIGRERRTTEGPDQTFWYSWLPSCLKRWACSRIPSSTLRSTASIFWLAAYSRTS